MNGNHISHATKGKLHSIFNLSKGKPINCAIIKAVYTETKEIYLPIVKLLKQVNIDPVILKNRIHNSNSSTTNVANVRKSRYLLYLSFGYINSLIANRSFCSSGFKVKYVGNVEIGNRGDIKVIDKAARTILGTFNSKNQSISNNNPKIQEVFFEIGEMGVKIVDKVSCEVLLKHSYMEISSCGSIHFLDNYFAYIAG